MDIIQFLLYLLFGGGLALTILSVYKVGYYAGRIDQLGDIIKEAYDALEKAEIEANARAALDKAAPAPRKIPVEKLGK